MNFKATLIAGGLAAALGTGAAFAQDNSGSPPPPPPATHAHGHHGGHGAFAVIQEEVSAGRLSQKEGTLIEKKIREMKRERRAERQARREGMQGAGSYGQDNPQPPPPSH